MARERVRHLFNKNHIEILKIENPETIKVWDTPTIQHISQGGYYHHKFNSCYTSEYVTVKKQSPLGFYYNSREVRPYNRNGYYKQSNCGGSQVIVTYPIPDEKNSYYQLKYYTGYGDNNIGGEDGLRPWDVYPGDKNFPDHMLTALVKEVTTFFAIIEASKNNDFYDVESYSGYYSTTTNKSNTHSSASFVRKSVFRQLFGNENGPRFQTDEEKILAHGFDPKYSFRKDKENK